jgi:hypothetical protein
MSYTSKTFSIWTTTDGGQWYTLEVLNKKGELIETKNAYGQGTAEAEFECLLTKYIFDYDNILT